MPDLTAQVVNVSTRTTQNGRVAYDIATSSGQVFTCWDGELARQLSGFVNQQPVTLRIRQKPSRDGQRTWEDVVAFAPMGQQLPPDVGGGFNQQAQGFTGVSPMQAAPYVVPKPYSGGGMSDEDKTRVTKLAALNDAAILVGPLFQGAGPEAVVEATNLVLRTAEVFYKRARSHENVPVSDSQPLPGATSYAQPSQAYSGAQIASDIPGVSLGAPVQVDVLPVPGPGANEQLLGNDDGWD